MISNDEKESFLALIAVGHDAATAARMVNPELTASMFRRLTNESAHHYNAEFTSAYLRAKAEGGRADRKPDSGEPRTTTLAGHVKAVYLTDEMLDEFLDRVAQGEPLSHAVEMLEPKTSLTQINRRVNRDPEFAQRYADAKEEGYPIFVQRLRDEAIRQAYNGDYKALRDQLLIHDQEFRKVLLAQKHEISGSGGEAIRLLAEKALPELPTEMIHQLVEHIERKELAQANGE